MTKRSHQPTSTHNIGTKQRANAANTIGLAVQGDKVMCPDGTAHLIDATSQTVN